MYYRSLAWTPERKEHYHRGLPLMDAISVKQRQGSEPELVCLNKNNCALKDPGTELSVCALCETLFAIPAQGHLFYWF
jgi:hypothetical protein